MLKHVVAISMGLVLGPAAPLNAADQGEIKALLEREIIGPALSLAEVQRFCEERVPEMPELSTAAEWEAEAERLRRAVLERIVYRGQAARWRDAETKVEWLETVEGGPGYRIKKLRYEALPGLWIPALLYEPEKLAGKVPAVLNVNGHTALGKQYPPKQVRCINQAKRGMLALNTDWLGMGQLRGDGFVHYRMNQLDLCGTSGLAPFYLLMSRGLDVLLGLEHADPERVAVTGLSGGGWQTIIISSLDTRVKLSTPVAGYSSFRTRARHLKDLGDSEQTPNDLATLLDYTHLTAMLAPRPALLIYNAKDDCCFESGYALPPLVEAAGPVYRLFGKEGLPRTHVNHDPGTHNYERENREAFYRMLGDFFYPGDETFDATEIPCDDEIKSQQQLRVELPEANEDFHSLALALSEDLPRDAELPEQEPAARAWQQERRSRLAEIVRAKLDYRVTAAVESDEAEQGGVKATFWRLEMGGHWTVPAVELAQGDPRQTTILVADGGRAGAAAEAARLIEAGHRVLAIDPFYFGESKIQQRDFLFALLVAAVGERPLGLQASQVAAAARWCVAERGQPPVALAAVGPRSSALALVAAALEEKAVGRVELHDSLGSLREVIERNWGANQTPEMLCFGLLEAFDVEQLAALVAPRPVRFVNPSDRAKKELGELSAWYERLGSSFDPLR